MNPDRKQFTYAIILPVYNEATVIESSVRLLHSFFSEYDHFAHTSWTILIADNGSTDGTKTIAQTLRLPNVRYIPISRKGKGLAIKESVKACDADYYILLDIDIPIELSALPSLLEPIESHAADIAIISRMGHRPWYRKLISLCLLILTKILLGLSLHDPQSGVKAFNQQASKVLDDCKEDTWFLDSEFLARAHQADFKIHQVPLIWIESRYPDRLSSVPLFKTAIQGIFAQMRIAKNLRLRLPRLKAIPVEKNIE